MRRWLVVLLAMVAGACEDDSSEKAAPSSSRVVAVQASEPEHDPLEAFCDVRHAANSPKLELPELASDAPVPPVTGWRWINLWATWCKPCIEEMPRLLEWQGRLAGDGTSLDMLFISVDRDAETVERFREQHTEIPESRRIANADALPQWLKSLGLDSGATIPIQVFVGPGDNVRCIRSGAVKASDLETVERLLATQTP